jgi:tripartite-type tricarboxylate transporter receptor subunit TctC
VPYRNIAQYGPDLIAGTVELGFQWYPNVSGALQAKGANALAVAGDKRLAILPDTPTTTEAGVPEYKYSGWFALMVPKDTPVAIKERLNKELTTALQNPDVIERFAQQGAEPMAIPLAEAKTFLNKEVKIHEDIITTANIPKL